MQQRLLNALYRFTLNVILFFGCLACTTPGVSIDDSENLSHQDGIYPGIPGKGFVKNVLIWEFATTDCKYCPYIHRDIRALQSDPEIGPRIIFTSIHGRLIQDDPFRFPKYADLEREFAVGRAYPTTVIDHNPEHLLRGAASQVNISRAFLTDALKEPATSGLKLYSEVVGRTLTLQVRFKTNEPGEFHIASNIVESNLVFPQSTPEPPGIDSNYVHTYVLRSYLTDLFGDPTGSLNPGDEFIKTYSYAVPENYDIRNLNLVAYVLKNRKTLNSAIVKAGETKEYQLID